MAETVTVRGARVKLRRPWGVFALALVTILVYLFVWYYAINRELRDFGRAFAGKGGGRLDFDPRVSLLAVTLGAFLVVPPFVSLYRTYRRVEAAQKLADVERRIGSLGALVLFGVLALTGLPFSAVHTQENLNRIWRRELA
jgi:uncharacterized BrkB/YihY/UPF0761 family membrane protein